MATKQEMVKELRDLGYTGPVSMAAHNLSEVLLDVRRHHRAKTEAQAHLPGWHGLKKGDHCKLAPLPGGRMKTKDVWMFLQYVEPSGKPPYVELKGVSQSTGGKIVTVSPERVLSLHGVQVAP